MYRSNRPFINKYGGHTSLPGNVNVPFRLTSKVANLHNPQRDTALVSCSRGRNAAVHGQETAQLAATSRGLNLRRTPQRHLADLIYAHEARPAIACTLLSIKLAFHSYPRQRLSATCGWFHQWFTLFRMCFPLYFRANPQTVGPSTQVFLPLRTFNAEVEMNVPSYTYRCILQV